MGWYQFKIHLRRCLDDRLTNLWLEVCNIVESISFSGDEDAMIWKFNTSGIYSVQSLYAIVNFGGISLMHIPAVWKISIPPRIHIFLWLVSHNKLLARDNLREKLSLMVLAFLAQNKNL